MDVTEGEVPTAAKLRKLRVVELRKRLQSLELPQSGGRSRVFCLACQDTCVLPYCSLLEPCELLGKARIYTVDLYLVYKVVLQTEPPPESTSLPLCVSM